MRRTRTGEGPGCGRVSAPMEELGRGVLARLPLRGDELVLDAGCGSGRITEALLERPPRGRVIAMDASAAKVAAARKRLQRLAHSNGKCARLAVVLAGP